MKILGKVFLKKFLCFPLFFVCLCVFPILSLQTNALQPVNSGTVTYSSSDALIDASNASDGYVMIKYTGKSTLAKVKITKENQNAYTYNLRTDGVYETFPFSSGNGVYRVEIFSHVRDNLYATSLTQELKIHLRNPMAPFLYSNQYVNFTPNSSTVQKANELNAEVNSQISTISEIYYYVINNVSYDNNKANLAKEGKLSWYIPNVDNTLMTNKGICFDYAAFMAAMLRSQNIPTKVEVGYLSDGTYHAWVSVYTSETGWIKNLIYFDGTNWKLMDPTFASGGKESEEIMKFINNINNYKAVYIY